MLADAVAVVHSGIVGYIVFGFLTPRRFLLLHLLTFPMVVFIWRATGNCPLTILEKRLRAASSRKAKPHESETDTALSSNTTNPDAVNNTDEGAEPRFIKPLIERYFGVQITDRQCDTIEYIVAISAWCISYARY